MKILKRYLYAVCINDEIMSEEDVILVEGSFVQEVVKTKNFNGEDVWDFYASNDGKSWNHYQSLAEPMTTIPEFSSSKNIILDNLNFFDICEGVGNGTRADVILLELKEDLSQKIFDLIREIMIDHGYDLDYADEYKPKISEIFEQ